MFGEIREVKKEERNLYGNNRVDINKRIHSHTNLSIDELNKMLGDYWDKEFQGLIDITKRIEV